MQSLENSIEVYEKTKNKTIRLSNFIPGHLSKKSENTNSKIYMHSNVHSTIIYNCQDIEATQMFIST